MPLSGLTIIGETINDSVPSTKKLFEAGDIDGILELARSQDEKGAGYIDVNVGPRSPEFMAEMVTKVQKVTSKPLSIDTPDPAIAKAGLEAFNLDRAGGKKPILNSISALRAGMFDLYAIQPFKTDPLGVGERDRRPVEAVPHGRGDPRRRAAIGRRVPRPMPRRDERRLHHRPGHCSAWQRFGGEHSPSDRRDGADSQGSVLCRLPRIGGIEQFHGDASVETARRFGREGTAGERVSDEGHAVGFWTW